VVAQYGVRIVDQARHLAGLALCMQALALDDLSEEERKKSYARASVHLWQLLETMMSMEYSAKVTECARRIDTATELWTADEIEARDGLPPAWRL
jgi:hypothetical protein